jgi:hypothetical protein
MGKLVPKNGVTKQQIAADSCSAFYDHLKLLLIEQMDSFFGYKYNKIKNIITYFFLSKNILICNN